MAEGLFLSSPCLKVEARKSSAEFWDLCEQYLRLPLETPKSQRCSAWRVPKIYHAVGKDATPPPAVVRNAATNPEFELRYLGDAAAGEYVRTRCGAAAFASYQCFVAPAYRADLFRYCALYADGGVYLDTDITLAVSIPEAVDMCDGATLGHDIPQLPLPPHQTNDTVMPGMQMKILGGEAGHPLFKCTLDGIIGHVRTRYSSRYPLQITGPALLAECYRKTLLGGMLDQKKYERPEKADATGWPVGFFTPSGPAAAATTSLHVTYRDSRNAVWPHSGLMGASGLLAFETPTTENYAGSDDLAGGADDQEHRPEDVALKKMHYHELLMKGVLYKDSCAIHA